MIRGLCRRDGFSSLELVIVVAISLIVAGLAIPSVLTTLYNARLRTATGTLSGVLQDGRMQSVKRNKLIAVHFAASGSGTLAYVDYNGNLNADSTESQVQLGGNVSKSTSPPVLLTTTTLGFTPESNLSLDPWFNSRGLPCKVVSGVTTCNIGFAFYFTDNRTFGTAGWAAVTVSPGGRLKSWFYNGSAWTD